MADNPDNKHVEIDEVQNFGGGVQSIEPMAEGDTKHGVHGNFHNYSGGEIIERTDTTLSPLLWAFWGFVIIAIVSVRCSFLALSLACRRRANSYDDPYRTP